MSVSPYEKVTPQKIIKAIEEGTFPNVIEFMIKQYGDYRARVAVEEIREGLKISLDKEIEDTLDRLGKAIDELYEKTLEGIREAKNGEG